MELARWGDGPRAFLGLHGWGGSHTTFAPLLAHLPPDVSLFAPDLPGYGGAPAPPEVSRAALVEAVVAAAEAVPAARFTLLGNCSGAILGLCAAKRLAARLERLVLVDPFAYMPWYFRLFTWGTFGQVAYASTFANPLGRALTDGALARKRRRETSLTQSFERVDHRVTLDYLRVLAAVGPIAQFGHVRAPVDLLYGERTFAAIRTSIAQWRALWPHARAYELAGAGHLPIEEAPAELARLAFTGGG
jgi:pimeloyl-ACP methyl ester carboxylesterase